MADPVAIAAAARTVGDARRIYGVLSTTLAQVYRVIDDAPFLAQRSEIVETMRRRADGVNASAQRHYHELDGQPLDAGLTSIASSKLVLDVRQASALLIDAENEFSEGGFWDLGTQLEAVARETAANFAFGAGTIVVVAVAVLVGLALLKR